MKQLEAPSGTRIVRRLLSGNFLAGFFKRQCDGRVFFARTEDERKSIFPVLTDKTISRSAIPFEDRPSPRELIGVIDPRDLGINGIKLAEISAQDPL